MIRLNQRTDRYGGSIENRARFVLEVAEAAINAIGKDKVGIRLSPFGVFNDMPLYDAMEADYTYLAQQLNAPGLVYIHLVDHSSMGAPPVPDSMKATFRNVFKGALILSGGYDAARAESDLAAGKCDLIAVGRPFLANPDLVARWKTGAAVNAPDINTFYTPGAKGYTDYPALAGRRRSAYGNVRQPATIDQGFSLACSNATRCASDLLDDIQPQIDGDQRFDVPHVPVTQLDDVYLYENRSTRTKVVGRFLSLSAQAGCGEGRRAPDTRVRRLFRRD